MPAPNERDESDANGITCDKNKRINEKWDKEKKLRRTHSLHKECKKRRSRKKCVWWKKWFLIKYTHTHTHKCKKSLIASFVVDATAATTAFWFCSISYMYLLIFINLTFLYCSMENCRWRMVCSLIDYAAGDGTVAKAKQRTEIKSRQILRGRTILWHVMSWADVKWNGCQR